MHTGERGQRTAVASAKRDIAARIRPMCAHFAEHEFDAMVQRMAEVDVHFRYLDDWTIAEPVADEGPATGTAP